MTRVAMVAPMLALMGAFACAPVEPPRTGRPSPPAPRSPSIAGPALEREIATLLNRHRARAGLPAMRQDPRLDAIAREHSRAMAAGTRAFGHAGFDARVAAAAREIPHVAFAENVAYDSRDGPELAGFVTSGWLASPGHRKNIEGAFDLTGVGAARSPDGVTYLTQLFVRR